MHFEYGAEIIHFIYLLKSLINLLISLFYTNRYIFVTFSFVHKAKNSNELTAIKDITRKVTNRRPCLVYITGLLQNYINFLISILKAI